MIGFLIGLLTAIIVLDCLLLILLVLIQLPKKEAGVGVAFGGAATDALFGAGSGNALTKITKYTAGIFLVGTLILSVLHSYAAGQKRSGLVEELNKTTGRPTQIITPATSTNLPAAGLLTNVTTNTVMAPSTNKAQTTPAGPVVRPATTNATK